ncbi:MAG: T9SS type A sorting domain-containing protein [Bacteroidia bacterium]|nr:T9SS type A sorting domain-containing protein [Bacteroidia bacterium]
MKYLILLIVVLCTVTKSYSQISFPKGNTVNLNTNVDFLYEETRIFFHTGNYKANDYNWEKLSDSLDSRWLIGSCFNGDCRNDLVQSGSFIKDYGINDTTCFIAFHIETHGFDGNSIIKYHIYNKNNTADSSNMIFNVQYRNTTGLNDETRLQTKQIVIVNPVKKDLIILNKISKIENVEIHNLPGELIYTGDPIRDNNEKIIFHLPDGIEGMYLLNLTVNGVQKCWKIIISP